MPIASGTGVFTATAGDRDEGVAPTLGNYRVGGAPRTDEVWHTGHSDLRDVD
ncbi:hypothetical protein [Marinobacterium lutimaris]|uniref:hypothetical protein n=1 Tax=Marinobacterium lutimaris TaxID=568106 RepID=UPI001358A2DA|nr:hypothetical protein [Marinobacterium lutimaris]